MARPKAKKSAPAKKAVKAKKSVKAAAPKKRPVAKAPAKRKKAAQPVVAPQVEAAPASAMAPAPAPVSFVLPENCDATAASKLRSDLIAIRGGDVQLDASQVRRVGVLSIQVLLSAKKTWNEDGRNFELVHPAGEFLSSLALLGLAGNGAQASLVTQ